MCAFLRINAVAVLLTAVLPAPSACFLHAQRTVPCTSLARSAQVRLTIGC